MKDSETKSNRVARFLLGELDTEQGEALRLEIENDPAAMDQLQQMQTTLEVLKRWGRQHDSLPPPEIRRPASKTRFSKRTLLPLVLAVSVLLALGLGIFFLPDRQDIQPGGVRTVQIQHLESAGWVATGAMQRVLAESQAQPDILAKAGPQILADGPVTLKGPLGSVLHLAPGGRVVLPKSETQSRQIRLITGRMLAQINEQGSEEPTAAPFVLLTDAADLKVASTQFLVEVNERKGVEAMKAPKLLTVMLYAGALQVVNPHGMISMLPGDVVEAAEGTAPVRAIEGLTDRFGKRYVPIKIDVKPSIPAYPLPLAKGGIGNYEYVAEKLSLGEAAEAVLLRNGLVASRWGQKEEFLEAYEALREAELPVYVTSDSVLHLYHVQFDETLKHIEQVEFIPKLARLSQTIIDHLLEERKTARDEDVVAGIDKAIAFYAVGYELLNDNAEEVAALRGYRDKIVRDARGRGYHRWSSQWGIKEQPEALRNAITGAPEARDEKLLNLIRSDESRDEKRRTVAVLKMLDAIVKRRVAESNPLDLPEHIRTWVDHDKKAARKHAGFAVSPIFRYQEDFSQYVPRGHYTRGYDLKRYFMAMMWFGRMTFLVQGGEPHGPSADYLISPEEARQQTIAACCLTRAIRDLQVGTEGAAEIWERIYGVTGFFVGLADDLTYTEYDFAFRKALGEDYGPDMLADGNNCTKVKIELARLRKPAVYSGTGRSETLDPAALAGEPSPEILDKILGKTQGFRLMGQRFVPDAYAMGTLVFPTVGQYVGKRPAEDVFTCAGTTRVFPRGLDVMALLGSERAKTHLQTADDSAYQGYDETFGKLAAEFSDIREPQGWNVNLYWSWLYCLKALLREYPAGCQAYMTTPAWQDKQLNTSLGSWSQLRHDTILYAKQSYTAGVPPQPKDYPGYVEPVPEFYARLLALTRLTNTVLSEMDVVDDATKERLAATDDLLDRLLSISTKELANQPISKDDQKWIKHFDRTLKNACVGYEAKALKTTLIADVHTDQNTEQVLQEATGYVGLLLVANRLPDGAIGLAAGPIFTYYEFKHPMSDRLTDEQWRHMLGQSKRHLPEKRPDFVKSYFVDK